MIMEPPKDPLPKVWVKCNHCPALVERSRKSSLGARCFECKKKQQKDNSVKSMRRLRGETDNNI